MKIKTSVTLSEELIQTIDNLPVKFKNRSTFLEQAAWAYLAELKRQEEEARDLEILNRRADYLNAEVEDALSYQLPL